MVSRKPFIYLFTGDEFLRTSKLEAFIRELVPDTLRNTNLFHIYGDDIDWSDTLSSAGTSSLLGGAQVFRISQADEIKKTDWAAFETYCSKPANDCYFVFEADELPQTHPLLKLVRSNGKHEHFQMERESGLIAAKTKLKRFGKTLTPDAWQILEERLGGSGRLMDTSLDQLILYSDEPIIDEEAVKALTKEFLRYEAFDLTEALARKDIAETLRIFHFFYEMSGDLTTMVGLIHWQLKRLWQAKKMTLRGTSREDVAKALRIPPFRMAGFMNQVKQFDLETLEKLLALLWQIDWSSKTGACDEQAAMEAFFAAAI